MSKVQGGSVPEYSLGRALGCVAFLALVLAAGCSPKNEQAGAGQADPFDESEIATFELSMDQAEWDAMVADLESNAWRRATLVWKGETYGDVAVHPAGQSSRQAEHRVKPSLWLSFKEFVPGREFHGYERVKLDAMADDPAMVRERLAYPIYAALGVPAPRVMHCRLQVNGRYAGLYLLEERVNKEFLTKRYGKTVNQLYRWTEVRPDVDYDPARPTAAYAAIEPPGSGPTSAMWEAQIESLPVAAEEIRELVRLLNEDPAGAAPVFDVGNLLSLMAVEVATAETDGYIGNNFTNPDEFYTGNLYLTRNPATGKFMLVVWDRDQSFWRGPRLPSDPPAADGSITFGFDRRILTRNFIVADAANLGAYRERLRTLAADLIHPATLNARLDAIVGQIREAAFADTNRLFAPSNAELIREWDDELRPRFQRRYDDILEQLSSP